MTARPSLTQLAGVWLGIGAQSFGGGASTFALIERAVVRERGWLSEAEYARAFALAQLSPGINLLGITILIGRRLGGVPGIILSLLGLLLPSVTITVLMTAGYAHVQHSPVVRAALRGVIPATVGLGLLTAFSLTRGLMAERKNLTLDIALLGLSALALAVGHLPVLVILLGGGLISAAASTRRRTP